MKNIKVFKSTIIVIIVCVIDWLSSNIPLIDFYKDGHISQEELLLNVVNSSSGYSSFLKCTMIYVILFLIFYDYLNVKDKGVLLIRKKNRDHYCIYKFKRILLFASLFTLIHEIINIIGVLIAFPISLVSEYLFIYGSIINVFTLIFFYAQTGLVLEILRTRFSKAISLLMASLIYIIQYYAFNLIGSIRYPLEDALVLEDIVGIGIPIFYVISVYGRSLLIIIVLNIIYKELFARKDIYSFE